MKVSCRTCESAFHVPDHSTEELGATAFCPFCGTQIAMQSSAPKPFPTPAEPDAPLASAGPAEVEGRTTSGWDVTKQALGEPVALVAEVDGDPVKLVPLGLPDDPNPPELEDDKKTVAFRRTPLPYVGRTEAFASPGGPKASSGKPKTEQLASMTRPKKEVTRPMIGAIPTPLPLPPSPEAAVAAAEAAEAAKPRRQITGGVELPGLDEIIDEARKQEEADIEASAPAPAALADLPPIDPEENILTSPFVASTPVADHVDLDSMFEDDLIQTGPVAPALRIDDPPAAAPAAAPSPAPTPPPASTPAPGASDVFEPEVEVVFEPTAPSRNEVFELELDAGSTLDPPADPGPRGIEVWRVIGESVGGQTKADILRRIRAGELGPDDRIADDDEPDDERSWPLSEVQQFKRYVMLFGRSGTSSDPGKKPFWTRFKRS